MDDTSDVQQVEGALVQGDGGAMYFIPASELEAFRLPPDMASEANEVLGDYLEPDVEGYAFEVQLRAAPVGSLIKVRQSIYGNIGVRTVRGPNDPTAVFVRAVGDG